ncbi:MAG: CvpA family protein [Roseitalea sp.]|jgi:membrane protein required for colicin V production|uniref:CvpA family protein n=1 Tax=Oceaniradius stylonematis TaxID=2184161 RepID=A0A3A8A7N1_9HYPH|nr:CvpA family protein [Oceaniradius stylonematis]MBO6552900.1 CvpA family protein [Roseitalea sp.]MBO6951340.1 CvpA family protein [Rhizobiaceae bacterium]RNC93664.1 MAG: CvpA family protein [Oricola sp.]MBO6590673.1 CvpA family protein [Roseitalea sp.]MBO6600069.1 CvpA family protein [Roseitalea sp.]
MPITLLDGLFLGLVLISAVLAMVRGFSREVLSIGSWVAAAVAAFLFYRTLTPYVQNYVDNELIAQLVAAGLIFLIALIVVTLITMRIADMIIDSRIGPLDRSLGFVFGAARGVIVAAVAIWFINFFVGDQEIAWIDNAKSKPFLDQVAQSLVDLLPDDLGAVVPGGETAETTDT